MKQIILITLLVLLIFSCRNQSCESESKKIEYPENTDSLKTNIRLFLNQFKNIQLPFSTKNLNYILLENDGRDVFDEIIFKNLNIHSLTNHNILKHKNIRYPVGKIISNKYSVILFMYKENEAGIIDPIFYAYILNNVNGNITDSLEIYRNYQWENVYKKDFSITRDTVFILKEYCINFPYYGITDNQDSLKISKEKNELRKYSINKHYKFETVQ